jgi:homoserine dehydrogenase
MEVDEFLVRSQAEVMIEITTLEPATGEPAISHIRAGFARGLHVVTANKGPIAHAYAALRDEAAARLVQFRCSTWLATAFPGFRFTVSRER